MENIPDFTPDCGSCAALCCLALAFDKGDDFAIDKQAGLPCPHLDHDFTCTLYDHLEDEGFKGCLSYDCRGAGQIVTRDVFKGANWRDDPELTLPMINAFATLRQAQEGLELIDAAARLDLPASLETERLALRATHAPQGGWTPEAVAHFDATEQARTLRAFLPRLRDAV